MWHPKSQGISCSCFQRLSNRLRLLRCAIITGIERSESESRESSSIINANNYIFLSCNSAIFSNELYPDERNLLFMALEQADFIIATLTPIVIKQEYVSFLKSGIAYGLDFPTLTLLLNQMYYSCYKSTPFVCCSKSQYILNNIGSNTSAKKDALFLSKKRILDDEILLISSEDKNSVFRFSDYILSFKNRNLEFYILSNEELLAKFKNNEKYIAFLEDFCIYLKLKEVIPKEEATMLLNVVATLRLKEKALSIAIYSILGHICSIQKYDDLIEKLNLIFKNCCKQMSLLLDKNYLFNYFESYIEQCLSLKKYFEISQNCSRCHSELTAAEFNSDSNQLPIIKVMCPICGVHSIYFYNHSFIKHGYRNKTNEGVTSFYLMGIKSYFCHFRLYDKSLGEVWFEKNCSPKNNTISVNTLKLNPDVHSYKNFLLLERGFIYIHGKYIKQ